VAFLGVLSFLGDLAFLGEEVFLGDLDFFLPLEAAFLAFGDADFLGLDAFLGEGVDFLEDFLAGLFVFFFVDLTFSGVEGALFDSVETPVLVEGVDFLTDFLTDDLFFVEDFFFSFLRRGPSL